MIYPLIASFAVMLASLSGILFASRKLSTLVEKNLHYLVSLSAGVFLVVAFNLSHETIEHSETVFKGLLWIAIGLVSAFILSKLIPQSHHHHDSHDHSHDTLDVKKIIYADALHNIGDGILIAGAFSIDIKFGALTTLGILIHEVLQEISEYFVMREAGWSVKKALTTNLLTSSSVLIGALGAHFLIETVEFIEPILLGIAGGVFFVIVLADLIPHSIHNSQNAETKNCAKKHILWFLLGVIAMASFSNFIGHGHEEHHDSNEHQEIAY